MRACAYGLRTKFPFDHSWNREIGNVLWRCRVTLDGARDPRTDLAHHENTFFVPYSYEDGSSFVTRGNGVSFCYTVRLTAVKSLDYGICAMEPSQIARSAGQRDFVVNLSEKLMLTEF